MLRCARRQLVGSFIQTLQRFPVLNCLTAVGTDATTGVTMLVWYENVAQAGTSLFSLSQHVVCPDTALVTGLDVVDVDGDGDLDIAAVSPGDGAAVPPSLSWFENIGGATSFLFSGVKHEVTGAAVLGQAAIATTVGDVDEDGDADFVVCSLPV